MRYDGSHWGVWAGFTLVMVYFLEVWSICRRWHVFGSLKVTREILVVILVMSHEEKLVGAVDTSGV